MNVIKISLKIKKFHNKCIFRILFFTHEKHKHFPKFFPCSPGHCAKGARLCLYVRARFVPLKRKSNFTSVDYQSLFYCTDRIFSFTKERKKLVCYFDEFFFQKIVFSITKKQPRQSSSKSGATGFEIMVSAVFLTVIFMIGVYRILNFHSSHRNKEFSNEFERFCKIYVANV